MEYEELPAKTGTPIGFTRFLWWLATADEKFLRHSSPDRDRYSIIGMSVLATWLFATLAWTYFFHTVTSSFLIALFAGIFMGFIILTIDRALIKGITAANKRKFIPLLFRALLALTIGAFMAQPAILYIFNKEITTQVSLDNEGRKLQKRQQTEAVFAERKKSLQQEQTTLQQALESSLSGVTAAQQQYLAETDGSGGTGKIGIKDIAIAKRNEYYKLDTTHRQLNNRLQPKLDSLERELAGIETGIRNSEKAFEANLHDGFLTRTEAMNNLLKTNSALQYRYYLILFILVLIELMPVIAKTLLPTGSYDEKIKLADEMEIEQARQAKNRDMALAHHYNEQSLSHNIESVNEFFRQQKELTTQRIHDLDKNGVAHTSSSVHDLWKKLKMNIFSRTEL